MKGKALIPLVVGLAVGLIAIKYTMDTVKKAGADSAEYVPVVVAMTDIPASVQIKPEMMKVIKSPKTPLLPPDVFSSADALVDRVSLKSIPQGSPLLPSMVAPEGTPPGLGGRLPEGFRAVTVKIDESSGVGYLIHPDDWVDVLVVMDVQKKGRRETISRVILQNVQVGAVGQVLNDFTEEKGARNVKSITLVVKKEDVPKLHLAQTRGRITLAMRGSEDANTGENAEATESEVLGQEDEEALLAVAKGAAPCPTPVQPQAGDSNPQPAPIQPPNNEVSVTLINGTASSGGEPKVKHVTFTDGKSMDVVSVQTGPGGRQAQKDEPIRTPVADSPFYMRRAGDSDADENETDPVQEIQDFDEVAE